MATHNLSHPNGLPRNRRNVDLRNTITMTNYGVSLVCNESYFTKEITQKIANNELFTRRDFPYYPHFLYVGMDDISEFTINSLSVRHRDYDGLGYYYYIERLIMALDTNTTIKCLDMSNCVFKSGLVKLLITILNTNTTFETVRMPDNFMDIRASDMMTHALQNNTTLKYVYLQGTCINGISFEYASKIINALEFNTTLKVLGLSKYLKFPLNWKTSSALSSTICKAFSANTTLEEITFTIWHDMMTPLLDIFEKNITLKKINIRVKCPHGVHDFDDEIIEFQKNILRIIERNRILRFVQKMETFILASTRKQLFLPDELWRPVFANIIS